ncbi:hypothetical protein [Pantoea ananatis]|uniref:hypothetical protein n=1 Tax=Pantoea ananas TaxID=553 RepID=UPI001B312622|nr:hypothetical protein [Pantoea ananatis]
MQGNELLVDHYHKTYDLTFSLWEKRNNNLLILLIVVGFSALLTFNVAEAQPLLVDIIAKLCGVSDATRITELRKSFPYGIIQSIFIIVVFYLMLNLYQKTRFIRRSYEYLSGVEDDIRHALSLKSPSISFTREGSFYKKDHTFTAMITGLCYVFILGSLLFSFLGMRLVTDWNSNQNMILIIDSLLSLGVTYFFLAYSLISLKK